MANKKSSPSEAEPTFRAPSPLPPPPAPPIGSPRETYVVQSLDVAKQPLAEMEVQAESHGAATRLARRAMPTYADDRGTKRFRVCRVSDGSVCETSYTGA